MSRITPENVAKERSRCAIDRTVRRWGEIQFVPIKSMDSRCAARPCSGASSVRTGRSRLLFGSKENDNGAHEERETGLKEAFDRLFLIRTDLTPTQIEESRETLQFIKKRADLRNKQDEDSYEKLKSGCPGQTPDFAAFGKTPTTKRKLLQPFFARDQELADLKKSKH